METKYKLGDTLQKMGMVRAFKDPRDPKLGRSSRACPHRPTR